MSRVVAPFAFERDKRVRTPWHDRKRQKERGPHTVVVVVAVVAVVAVVFSCCCGCCRVGGVGGVGVVGVVVVVVVAVVAVVAVVIVVLVVVVVLFVVSGRVMFHSWSQQQRPRKISACPEKQCVGPRQHRQTRTTSSTASLATDDDSSRTKRPKLCALERTPLFDQLGTSIKSSLNCTRSFIMRLQTHAGSHWPGPPKADARGFRTAVSQRSTGASLASILVVHFAYHATLGPRVRGHPPAVA